jgi:hypothetical protein
MHTYIGIYTLPFYEGKNGKLKPRRFSLICLPFAHHSNGGLLFVSLLTKKQAEVICLQTEKTDLPIYGVSLCPQCLHKPTIRYYSEKRRIISGGKAGW